jgi:transcriptional regulator with XRE-family HTH domain
MVRHTMVDARFGARMRELRDARGLSLRALATRALSNKSQLQAFEVGREQPSVATALRIDEALGAGGVLAAMVTVEDRPSPAVVGLEFASSWSSAVDVAASLWHGDLGHRSRLRRSSFTAAAFVAPAMRWLTASFEERPRGSGNRPVVEPDVDTVRLATSMFRTLDNQYGGGHIREMVVRFLDAEVAPLLRNGRFDASTGSALLSATAELTQLAGWASYDSGLHGLGQRYLIQALRLAMTAVDRPLGAEIVAAMSHQAAYLNAPDEAVDLARAAAHIAADAGVTAIVAEAAVLEAQGLALRGEESASAAALDRAERTLDRADRDSDPQWIRYFDEAYLSARFGHCFAALERGDLAQRFAARSLEMDGRYVRGRQFNLALLAKAHAQAGNLDEAAAVGMEAVDMAERLRSARSIDYLRDLADRLAPHVGLAAVDDFVERARPLLHVVKTAR